MKQKNQQQNKGQALLTAVSVIGTILMSVITIAGYLSVQRIRTSRAIVGSGAAITRADAGIESALDTIFAQEYFIQTGASSTTLYTQNATTTITRTNAPCTGYTILSRSEVGGSVRAVELDICE